MSQPSPFLQLTDRWALTAVVLLLLGLALNMGNHPLYHEEPRRAMVAWEMMQNGNWFAPTIMGEYYYKKPPLFNWMLALNFTLFGVNEWAARLLSPLSLLLMGWLTYRVVKRYQGQQLAKITALLLLFSANILFYFTVTGGEIDLFFSLLMVLFFFNLFHRGQQQQWLAMYVGAYIFAALGFLTKAMPALAALGLTLPAYVWYFYGWRKLFHWAHFVGISVFLLLIGGFLYFHEQQNPNGVQALFMATWGDSAERTVAEKGIGKGLLHLLTFPVELWEYLLPGSILLIFSWWRGSLRQARKQPLIAFAMLVIVVNIPIYWLSPGTRSRYLYFFFPFFNLLFAYLATAAQRQESWQVQQFFRLLILIVSGLLGVAAIVLCFLPVFDGVPYLLFWMPSIALAAGLLFFGLLKRLWGLTPLAAMLLALALGKIGHSASVLPKKALDSSQQADKQDAKLIADKVGDAPLYVFGGTRFSYTTLFYLQCRLGETLQRSTDLQPGQYFIVDRDLLPSVGLHAPLYPFRYREKEMVLARKE